MDAKDKKQVEPVQDQEIEWGETKQERIVEKSPHSKSTRHECKGPRCDTAFEKL